MIAQESKLRILVKTAIKAMGYEIKIDETTPYELFVEDDFSVLVYENREPYEACVYILFNDEMPPDYAAERALRLGMIIEISGVNVKFCDYYNTLESEECNYCYDSTDDELF